ncbi:preprotein translocase subunit SecG [Luteolibacter ambystomatis]|uniref:Protein-export membrane protein SecG n=1 Tax=Luteolibacter ambystomatis TaxID=2824561 RepID=A0A975IYR6_9BACT|nr:preprotein translocase subunit SecG [Luteolibacter ambystomatis]QUE50158.1 preprotein translocase subunit SecG [Luteolibacter ambystomatis]
MILADIPWLNLSINLLLVIFFFVCVMMVLLILMQRPKQEGLGATFGTNVTDQVFGARTTNVLQRGTVYLATAFFILALTLAILIGHRNAKNTLIDKNAKEAPAPVAEAPAAPVAPVVPAPTEAPAPTTAVAPPVEAPKTGDAPKSEEAPKTETPAQPAAPADAPAKPAEPAAPANGGEKPADQ